MAVVACSGSGGPASASPASSDLPTAPSDAYACPDLDLRTPTGERLDLNGTWETVQSGHRSGIYYVRQVGSCLWFVGGFPWPDDPVEDEVGALGVTTTNFVGRVGTDFSIRGTWIDYPHTNFPPAQGGTLDLRIEFDESGVPRLAYVDDVGERFLDPTLVVDELTWVQLDDGWRYPPALVSQ